MYDKVKVQILKHLALIKISQKTIRRYILTESNFTLLIVSKLVQLFLCLPPKVDLLSNGNTNEFSASDGTDTLHLHLLDIKAQLS